MMAGSSCDFSFPHKNIIENVVFFVLSFSFDVYGRVWAKKNLKNLFTAASGGVFSCRSSYFGHFKNRFLSSGHQILQDTKKFIKQKSSLLMRSIWSMASDLS